MTAPSPSNQQRAAEIVANWRVNFDHDDDRPLTNMIHTYLDEATVRGYHAGWEAGQARGRAEGLEQGRGDLEAWQRTCRAEGRAEAAAKIREIADGQAAAADLPVLAGDRFDAGVAAAYRDSADRLRALAADLTAPADRSQP